MYSKSDAAELIKRLEIFGLLWDTMFDRFKNENWRQAYERSFRGFDMRRL